MIHLRLLRLCLVHCIMMAVALGHRLGATTDAAAAPRSALAKYGLGGLGPQPLSKDASSRLEKLRLSHGVEGCTESFRAS